MMSKEVLAELPVQHKSVKSWFIPEAEGMRGLAVLIVLTMHIVAMFFPEYTLGITGAAKIGVWLFFVLSSFLLTNQFLKNGLSFCTLRNYFIGRCIRILPLFIMAVFIYCAFGYFDYKEALKIISLRDGWGHFWTIPVEFKFYFLLPIFVCILNYVKVRHRIGGVVVAVMVMTIVQQAVYPYNTVKQSSIDTSAYIACFLFGVSASYIYTLNIKIPKIIGDSILAISILFMVISTPVVKWYLFGREIDNYLLDKFLYFSFAWSVFIIIITKCDGYTSKIMRSKTLSFLGKWSYSIYLFHFMIFIKISNDHPGSFLFSGLAFLLSILVGALAYNLFELPLDLFRHKFINKKSYYNGDGA